MATSSENTNTDLENINIEDPEHGIKGQKDPNSRIGRYGIMLISVVFSLLFLYTAGFGMFDLYVQRSVFILFCLVLVFLLYPLQKDILGYSIDGILIILSIVTNGYILANYEEIAHSAGILSGNEIYLGIILVLLIFEASRRCIGSILSVLCVIFIGYAYFGNQLPGYWGHRGYSIGEIIGYLYLTADGIWSFPVGIASTYIITFVIFGAFLLNSGIADLFTNLSMRIAGRITGGPALVAVIASSLFGTVSGAAPANVATTGSVTIPMMKSIGFDNDFAAAVESSASAGGLLMPPIMGAAAFLMVEFTGIAYREIIIAATVPALLYYLGVGLSVYFVANREGVGSWSQEQINDRYPAPLTELQTRGHLLLPLIVLVVLIFAGWAVTTAAFYSLVFVVIISWVRRITRMDPKNIIVSLDDGGRKTLEIGMACAAAGIIYAIVNLTGLGVKFASIMLQAAEINIILALIVIMLGCIILGMGLPATVAYLIAAAVTASGMEALGFSTLSSHLFIFYFAIIATITPPVGLALYTAAAIAGSHWLNTGIEAVKITFVGFIIPYVFIFNDGILLQGDYLTNSIAVLTVTMGIIALSIALSVQQLGKQKRALFAGISALLFYPAIGTYVIGLTAFLVLSAYCANTYLNLKNLTQA